MGMFDTIHLEKPIGCPICGAELRDVQTKEFDSLMNTYRIGSVIHGSAVLTGIVKDELWCQACWEAKRESRPPVYFVIWHSILAGVEQSESAAESRLSSIDRLDLIGWLDEAQRSSRQWRERFDRLLDDFEKWHQHVGRERMPESSPAKTGREELLCNIFRLPDEILNSPDPVAAILESHRRDAKDEKTGNRERSQG